MSRMTLFLYLRVEGVLSSYKFGTKAADWSPLLTLIEETVRWYDVLRMITELWVR